MRDDIYDEDKLRADQELLRRFYYNHGYADFQVVSAVGELDATNKYTVTITVEEGQRYTFGDVSVESTIPEVDAKSLQSVVQTRKGDVYNAKDVEDSIVALTEKVAGSGYAFAQVTPRGDRNFENHTISVVYTIDQGTKAYIERIEIRGNARTRDYVIRREFDVSEGDAFNQVLIQRAKKRLEDAELFSQGRNLDGPGLAARSGCSGRRRGREVDRRILGRRRLFDRRRHARTVRRRIGHRAQLPRPRPVHQLSAGGGKNSRDYAFPSPSPISSDGASRPASTSSSRPGLTTTTTAIRRARPSASACRSPTIFRRSWRTICRRRSTRSTTVAVPSRNADPDGCCNVSTAILNGIEESPWIKSSVSLGLFYNTIDDMKNPHERHLLHHQYGSGRSRRRCPVGQAHGPRQLLPDAVGAAGSGRALDRRRRASRRLWRPRRFARLRLFPEQRSHDPRL